MNDKIREKVDALLKELRPYAAEWIAGEKVGNIQVNFFKGGVSTLNLNETKKLGIEKHG